MRIQVTRSPYATICNWGSLFAFGDSPFTYGDLLPKFAKYSYTFEYGKPCLHTGIVCTQGSTYVLRM